MKHSPFKKTPVYFRFSGCFLMIIAFCFLFKMPVQAQTFPSELWHEGKILLISNDTLRGLVKYNLERDLVQFQEDKKIQTFSSRKILFFEVFDVSVDRWRQFYALPYHVKRNYKVPILFEVLYQGKLSLLCREVLEDDNSVQYGNFTTTNNSTVRKKLVHQFYFIDRDGKIHDYGERKKELLDLMDEKASEVKDYMKENKLKPDEYIDLIQITEFYNKSLEEKED